MSSRQSKFAWGVALGLCGLVCVGLTLGQPPAAKGPAVETLLPANSVVYVNLVGQEASKEAWEKTAAHDALYKTGLMDAIAKMLESAAGDQAQEAQLQALQKGLEHVQNKGCSIVISLPNPAAGGPPLPPIPSVVAVLHDAAVLEPGLNEMVTENAPPEIEITEREIDGRKVTGFLVPEAPLPIEVSWWSEGTHLVFAAGLNAAQATIDVATGKSPNITTDANWKKYHAGNADFDVAFVAWLDFGALRTRFGEMEIPVPPAGAAAGPVDAAPATGPVSEDAAPAAAAEAGTDEGAPAAADPEAGAPAVDDLDVVAFQPANLQEPKTITINQILKPLGLDTMGTLVCRSGYKGKALWSETTLEAPAPRRGLLALWDQKPITMADLPPLPFGQNGFYACSVDLSKSYDDTITMVRELAKLGPEQAAVQVEGAIQNLPAIVGFDPKTELFDPLGDVFCVYGDTRQGVLGLGSAIVVKVEDAPTLRRTLMDLAGTAAEQTTPDQLNIRTTNKHGRDIVTFEVAGGVFNPSYVVDDNWLAIGLFPQTVEAFVLRVDGRLTNWTPTLSYQQSLAAMPKEFTSISASDPRKSVRFLMGLAPIVLPAIQAALKQAQIPGAENIKLDISAADLPPAELVARPLFPNIGMCTVDEKGFYWTSRESLPSIPLIGGAGGLATVGVAAALLLPAVQQARSAAQRTSSMNNLKQIGLALHNYHDAYRSLPQGTQPNEKLKPDKRISWQAGVLPFVEQNALYQRIDFDEAWDSDVNKGLMKTEVEVFQNPGVKVEEKPEYGTTHYVGIAGIGKDAATLPITDKNAGVFGYDRKTRFRDITDGTSNTIMVGEASKSFGAWGAGGTATIRGFVKKPYINGPDNIGGPYPGGCNFLFCDGAVRFVSDKVDPSVIENLARIHDGNPIGDF